MSSGYMSRLSISQVLSRSLTSLDRKNQPCSEASLEGCGYVACVSLKHEVKVANETAAL